MHGARAAGARTTPDGTGGGQNCLIPRRPGRFGMANAPGRAGWHCCVPGCWTTMLDGACRGRLRVSSGAHARTPFSTLPRHLGRGAHALPYHRASYATLPPYRRGTPAPYAYPLPTHTWQSTVPPPGFVVNIGHFTLSFAILNRHHLRRRDAAYSPMGSLTYCRIGSREGRATFAGDCWFHRAAIFS